jgi:hypothetical protein
MIRDRKVLYGDITVLDVSRRHKAPPAVSPPAGLEPAVEDQADTELELIAVLRGPVSHPHATTPGPATPLEGRLSDRLLVGAR